MEIPATKENRVLANAVNARIRSDARIQNAQAAFWRLAGIGLLCSLAGVGIGAIFYGYSYANPPTSTENVARIVSDALSRVTFKTEGTVKLDPEAKLAVGSGASEMPRPTEAQLGAGATAPAAPAVIATAFTVFKNVPFGSGQVVTGWNFVSSDQKSPGHQYCYYSEQLDGTSKVTIDLGENGRPAIAAKSRPGMDPAQAFANCVWFKSGAI